jgi:hypothetical protein
VGEFPPKIYYTTYCRESQEIVVKDNYPILSDRQEDAATHVAPTKHAFKKQEAEQGDKGIREGD